MNPNIFAVCPHDTARGIDKWALFHTLVNKQVGMQSKFNVYLNFAEFQTDLEKELFLWAYLNPADYLKLKDRFGYDAVARPTGRFDMAYVIGLAQNASPGETQPMNGKRIAAVKGYLNLLVSHQFNEAGIKFTSVPAKSYADVLNLLEKGEADFGVTYNEHFDPLVESTRAKFVVITKVDCGLSHVIAAHPSVPKDLQQSLANLLMNPNGSPEGQRIMTELKLISFEQVPEAPFQQLHGVMQAQAG